MTLRDVRWVQLLAILATLTLFASAARSEKLHYTYLWHLEQPIYWPDQRIGIDRYERAWESILRKDGGAAHPENNLREIFSWPDRVAAYQHRTRDAIGAMSSHGKAGAQISYSGGLVENVVSLGSAGQLGYQSNWYSSIRQARGWTTTGGHPRADVVVFPFHHPLLPLVDEATVRKEVQLYKALYDETWGTSPGMSRGLFPPEMAFSQRLIPILEDEGIDWVFVSAEHISRACANFPVVLGTGGINCDPPNPADQVNPAQDQYYRVQIDRGCSPAEAYPYALTPRYAQHVDPGTGEISKIIVVPCSQSLGWMDGYSAIGLTHFDALQTHNDPSRPMLIVMAHDGDNAWGGGYSYYMEATPDLANSASAAGFTPTIVEQYLQDYPVPSNDITHVEDGAWVNADGDFGAPQMLNWNWPPVNGSGQIDIENGWAEDIRNWAVITAAQNRVETAEQITGGVDIERILYPENGADPAERAWHYFLGALNSGYMYYGTSLDMEVKPTVACNNAMRLADPVIGDGSNDTTAPTIWIPQRHPWNPGALNFGPQYGYQPYAAGTDCIIWTFAYDVSGLESVTLHYRVDNDGHNPIDTTDNDTYAGGDEVGPWQTMEMAYRDFPAGNVHGDPSIDFFVMPDYIADQYTATISGHENVLIDYYVEARDERGNVKRSPIQHVWIDDGSGSSGGDTVLVDPDPVLAGEPVTVTYDPAGRPLDGGPAVHMHYGFDGWVHVVSPDPVMTWDADDEVWRITVDVRSDASQFDVVFRNADGTVWDNNGGADWHFAVEGGEPGDDWTMDGILDGDAIEIATSAGRSIWAGIKDATLYVAVPDAGEGFDHFILLADTPGSMQPAPWAKAGQVAAWDAFLADENDNDYCAWFDADAATQAATGPNGGVLEGTVSLTDLYGVVPDQVALALARYQSPDGGQLDAASQVPASVNGDGNVDAAEYLIVDTDDLIPGTPGDLDGDGDVDLADLGILLASFEVDDGGDLDGDGDTDLSDLGILLANFGA